MDEQQNGTYLLTNPFTLPLRRGKRPTTIRGPLHLECSDNGNEGLLCELVGQVVAWPGIEARPLPVGSGDLVSLRVNEAFVTDDPWADRHLAASDAESNTNDMMDFRNMLPSRFRSAMDSRGILAFRPDGRQR